MMRSAIVRELPAPGRTSPAGRAGSPGAIAAGRPCWPSRPACARRPPRSRRGKDGSVPRSGRATPRPSSATARSRPRSSGFRRSPTRVLPRWGRRAIDAPPTPPPRPADSGSSSCNSSTGFSSISCSIRSCKRQDGQLQNLHRLDHPRRQHLLLHESEILAEGKTHGNQDDEK